MQILQIMAGRGLGGAETYSTDVMLSLHAAGVDQCVVMAQNAPRFKELQDAGIRMAPHVLAIPFRPLQRWLLRRLVEKEKPDLIHCWMRRAASLVPSWKKGPVIGWFGGYYDPKNFKRCKYFVGVTEDIVAHMVKNNVPPENAFYVQTFPDVKEELPVDRTMFHTPKDAKVLLALSRLHPKKGLDTLLQALQAMPGVMAWLAGDGPLRRELEALAKTLGVEDRVRFLGWRTDRGALLRAADVCVLPSRYEPFGTVILEAWAAKTPFVACRSAGPAGHVRDGVDGLLVPIDDAPALAAALARALDDATLRQKMIDEGYARYKCDFTREVVTQRMTELYKKLIQQEQAR